MYLGDLFGKEDRVEITTSDFYAIAKESSKLDIIEDAYSRGHDPRKILEIIFESKDTDSYQYIGDKEETITYDK